VTQIEEEFVGAISEMVELSGLPLGFAPLYARIYIHAGEVAMEELARETGYSLASISLKVRFLERFGLVIRRKHPGTSKVFFFAPKEVLKSFFGTQLAVKERNIEVLKARLPKIVEAHRDGDLSKDEKEQLENVRQYLKEAVKFEKLIKKMRIVLKEEVE
jgi:DNA-binding transcriptional regulator GbsR (MarR family)